MGLLDPRYTESELIELDKIQSHINVARAVLETRVSKGMTQEQVGRAAGTKQSRISEIEALKGNPRFDTLDRIARVLGLMVALVPREATAVVEEPPVQDVAGFDYGLTLGHVGRIEVATGNRHVVFTAVYTPMKA